MTDWSVIHSYLLKIFYMNKDLHTLIKRLKNTERLIRAFSQSVTKRLDQALPASEALLDIAVEFMAEARILIADRDNSEGILAELADFIVDEVAVRGGDVNALAKKVLLGSQEMKRSRADRSDLIGPRERIMNAALTIFSQKGYHNATMEEISEAACLAKGTLYHYFKKKEELFKEIVMSKTNNLAMEVRKFMHRDDDVLTMISNCLRVYLEFFDRDKNLYKVFLQERQDFGSEMKVFYIAKVLDNISVIKEKIHMGVRNGLMKDLNFFTVFYGVMGFVDGVMQKWLARGCSYPLSSELPGVLEVLYYGFVNKNYMQEAKE